MPREETPRLRHLRPVDNRLMQAWLQSPMEAVVACEPGR